ncbi:MAG: SufS family cysteine desulfurase [Bacteroidales bacterium]|nr:SufS family cysteine desulfurase [Bacteroidales bacterium]
MTIKYIRDKFKYTSRMVAGRPVVYLDNAATSQRPAEVLDKYLNISTLSNANIHRAVHTLAVDATDEYEAARDVVKEFIGAEDRKEIIFTSGTTASINLVAFSFGEAFVHEGDEIIVSEAEHHSNIVPWQMMCQRKGAVLKVLPVDDSGHLRIDKLETLITPKTRLLAVTHVSNVLGLVNPIPEIAQICHSHGVKILVDGAQGIVHQRVDVKKLDCDFYAFSGHKIYAVPGTGVLYGKKELLDAMPPYMGGGEMIETVKFSGTTYAPLPEKFEAGTQNISGAPTFIPAISFAKEAEAVETETSKIRDYVLDALTNDPRIRLFGVPRETSEKIPLFSFCVEGAHHEDLALILDKMGIAVRSGQMCAEPVMDRFGVTGMLRASFAPYNTMEEAEYFIKCLDRAIKMLV